MAKKKTADIKLLIVALIAAATVIVIGYGFDKTVTEGTIEDKCRAIQDSPELNYPCICYPTVREINESDYVDNRTMSFCTCECDIGTGEPWVTEIRVAE